MRMGMGMALTANKTNGQKDFLAALLPAGLNRVAAIYTDPANPSYDECIAQNRKALGPERVVGGWITPVGNDNTTAQTSPTSFITVAGTTTTRVAAPLLTGLTQGSTVWVMARLTSTIAVGSLQIYAREGSNPGAGAVLANSASAATPTWVSFSFIATRATANLLFTSSMAGQAFAVDSISAMEIADWSQIVLFDDAVGTVPIFSPLQSARGRGLLLDRSFGLVRGPELALNGTFDTNTSGWSSAASTITHSAGKATVTISAQQGRIERAHTVEANNWYEATCDISDVTVTAGARINAVRGASGGYASLGAGNLVSSVGQSRVIFFATGTDIIVQTASGGTVTTGTFTVDNISLKKLPGNHMSQPTAAARGEFSARYNLATNTEFTAGVIGAAPQDWIERGDATGRVVADIMAPSGRALRVLSTSASGFGSTSDVRQAISGSIAGSTVTARVLAKSVPGQVPTLRVQCGPSASVELALNDAYSWHTMTFTTSGVAHSLFFGGGSGFAADVAAVDVRLTADAIPSIPPYQRVTSATDYDDVGFPTYHRAQTDDWAKARINPNGATKALVLAAAQVMAATQGITVETGPSVATDGTIALQIYAGAPNTGKTVFESNASGPVTYIPVVSAATRVLAERVWVSAFADIAADLLELVTNGQVVLSAADQGTGTYTEQDVHFGARAGTSLFVNTREPAPPLILFLQSGDTLPSSYVARLQKAYEKAAGVTV